MASTSRILNKILTRCIDSYEFISNKLRPVSYDIVFPCKVSPPNVVPNHISYPLYVHGEMEQAPLIPLIKTPLEVDIMRSTCRLAKNILNAAGNQIKPGLSTDALDKYVHKLIIDNMAYPSPLHYNGFPKSICTSVNNVVCHGIPDERPLSEGDIITVDITVYHKGYHGDCAATFLVGEVDKEGQKLVHLAEAILNEVISKCKPGERLEYIGYMIRELYQQFGLNVIPAVCGHGIGRYFHEKPQIVHDVQDYEDDTVMEPGMVFTIEPVFGEGDTEVVLLEDNWTLVTADDSRTAQFEHTILITPNGAEILTR